MVTSPTGLGPENDCAGKDQQDPSSRQREHPTSTNPQLVGRAIALAVSRRLPTAAARVQTRVWSCGIL
jgi:hypothetical protein